MENRISHMKNHNDQLDLKNQKLKKGGQSAFNGGAGLPSNEEGL